MSLMLFLSVIFCAAMLCAFFILQNKVRCLKLELQFATARNLELSKDFHALSEEKIDNIRKIESLSAKLEYQQQLIADSEKSAREHLTSTKAALFELGNDLSKQLLELHKRENKETKELSEQNIAKVSEKFNCEFERLINMVGALNNNIEQSKNTVDIIKQSLLSPSGSGKLAEITLENILKSSGLRPNLDFTMQYSLMSNELNKLRPDALVFLPGGNLMVVDAKASRFLMDDTDPTNLAKTMNSHLKSLASKDYAETVLQTFQGKNFTNVITLMFLPTEQSVEKLIEADNGFMQKAWSYNIFPVGPAGIMNMLSFAKFQISEQLRSENHKSIIEEVRKLLISISSMAEHSQRLGNNIQSIVSNYDKFAGSFNRNFLARTKKIQALGIEAGAKTAQSMLERYQIVSSKAELIEVHPEPQNLGQEPEIALIKKE